MDFAALQLRTLSGIICDAAASAEGPFWIVEQRAVSRQFRAAINAALLDEQSGAAAQQMVTRWIHSRVRERLGRLDLPGLSARLRAVAAPGARRRRRGRLYALADRWQYEAALAGDWEHARFAGALADELCALADRARQLDIKQGASALAEALAEELPDRLCRESTARAVEHVTRGARGAAARWSLLVWVACWPTPGTPYGLGLLCREFLITHAPPPAALRATALLRPGMGACDVAIAATGAPTTFDCAVARAFLGNYNGTSPLAALFGVAVFAKEGHSDRFGDRVVELIAEMKATQPWLYCLVEAAAMANGSPLEPLDLPAVKANFRRSCARRMQIQFSTGYYDCARHWNCLNTPPGATATRWPACWA